ncbi:MAG: isoprenylcysteine carboxylmethyltransferase family protein [Bacteroidales bacterium]|nr:isoprenylcysteine carboxylmethyltransferase family protein [Bacteroidales bacterium]MCF8327735.1 isoprenylcysteine carboxylmethyltransferase family protein [Bacteroidales bacterium]
MLKKELEDSGEILFKNRSYIPLILFALATIALLIDKDNVFVHNSLTWNILCLAVSLFGLLIRVLTVGNAARNTSGRNTSKGQIADSINTTGMYSLVRHPLYLGNFFMWLGIILYVAIPWLIVLSLFFFYVLYERIMLAEERYVRQKFKDQFDTWAQTTPAFFPVTFRWKKSDRQFSIKKVMRREYSGILALSVSFAFVDFMKNLQFSGIIDLNNFWIYTGSIGVILWFTLRSLRKWTNVLESRKN